MKIKLTLRGRTREDIDLLVTTDASRVCVAFDSIRD